MSIECALGCGRPLNPHDIGVWKEVRGFVGGPKKDAMTLREDTGRYAHDSCVRAASTGTAPDTQPLIEEREAVWKELGMDEDDSDGRVRVSGDRDMSQKDINELEGMLGDDSR